MVMTDAYWRPSTLAQALELLERPGAVVLAGGSWLNADTSAMEVEVVDLQELHLDGILAEAGDSLRIGAMTTLQSLVESEQVPGMVGEAARREQPSTLRAQATIGGCVATGDAESELLAALLVHQAVVSLETVLGSDDVPLEELLGGLPLASGRVVTSVTIRTDGVTAAAHTARTPADRAIVAAYARSTQDGGRRVALAGVASTPILVEPGTELDPVGDFRGSSDYRKALADVLMARVVEEFA